jgi:hypothetical protein
MMGPLMKATVGEQFVAVLMSGFAAFLAAIAGFVGTIYLCGRLLRGEMTDWALILAPATAVVFAIAVFVLVFRKITTYGDQR